MHYTIEQVGKILKANHLGVHDGMINWLLTDSRSLSFPEGTLFFAIHTQKNDGHHYIEDLYKRGVRSFVIEKIPDNLSAYPKAAFLQVPNSLEALQQLATACRLEFQIPVIGVTGSNGKTVVKEWINQLLSPDMHIVRSPRSYNSQIGVPLSVWLLNDHSELGVFEAGISKVGEMERLQQVVQPTIGVFTNLGTAHQENFASKEEKCREKMQLFKHSDVLIFNADDVLIADCAKESGAAHLMAWSQKDASSELFISRVQKQVSSTLISYQYKGDKGQIEIPFISDASVENAIHCLAVCLYLHLSQTVIKERMLQLEQVAMRLEVKEAQRGCVLINDSYNSDIQSLDIALDFMNRRPDASGKRRTLILSDILQTGLTAGRLYEQVAQLLDTRNVNCLIGVGPEISSCASLFKGESYFFKTTRDLLESAILQKLSGEVVLVKGARPFGFEKVIESLELKVHETILEVNLNALVQNINYYRSFMKPETKMVCMVKASGYGTGALEVSKTLQDCGVDYLAVAVADEGADLRKGGVTGNILIMNPEMTSFKTLFDYQLEPEVYNFGLLEALIHAAEKEGVTNFPIHIKLDTGMHRLGFNPETDMQQLVDRLHKQTAVIPKSVFSHFVGSDSSAFDAFSDRQFALFKKGSEALQAGFSHKIIRHICNSAGIERFPERHLDMVRLGLGIYGINSIDNEVIHNVATLKTTILQIREVPAGDSIGYSRKTVLERDSRIAAIPIGYADGLNRRLGNRKGFCLVNGQPASYVGNICMDVCMIDVSDISCKEGDKVEIFGDNLPVRTLSDLLETIPYEVLTSVSTRVKRVYYKD